MGQLPPPPGTANNNNNNRLSQQKRKVPVPSPKELISHYESQGLNSDEASIKVIEDLQNALFRVISSGRGKKDKLVVDISRKIDATNNRVAVLDLKLDSKPGYAETFAIGLASGTVFNVMPHVFRGLSQIWSSVTSVTKQSS